MDEKLGAKRNQGCRAKSLDTAIEEYVTEMKVIDFDGCPNDFQQAFVEHVQAWEKSRQFFREYDDLRGEMHDLFEQIRMRSATSKAELEEVEKQIWATWGKVEEITRSHATDSK